MVPSLTVCYQLFYDVGTALQTGQGALFKPHSVPIDSLRTALFSKGIRTMMLPAREGIGKPSSLSHGYKYATTADIHSKSPCCSHVPCHVCGGAIWALSCAFATGQPGVSCIKLMYIHASLR